jgi:CheY-like chemotaxis protein
MQKMESLGQLTGGVAHDFNNLLMAILSNLALLRKRLPDERKVTALLDNALQGAERGVSLTRRMLAFARRQDLKIAPVVVPDLINGMAELVRRSLDPSITVTTSFPLGLAAVLADANQLESAVLNLVLNARDAMPGGGSIDINAREKNIDTDSGPLKAGRYVCLSVVDNGEGMDKSTLARASEPFFTTKGVGKGTGLGLSMVRGLAEQLNGALFLRSRKGEGTTAELWLPAATKTSYAATPKLLHEAQPAVERTRPLVILIVDDDALILMSTAAMMEDLGHRVLTASSGEDALKIVGEDEPIDLVVTDQGMPYMTGIQLAEKIKSERPELPIVLATGYSELPAGAPKMPTLNKPFLEQDLARAIAKAMDTQSRRP